MSKNSAKSNRINSNLFILSTSTINRVKAAVKKTCLSWIILHNKASKVLTLLWSSKSPFIDWRLNTGIVLISRRDLCYDNPKIFVSSKIICRSKGAFCRACSVNFSLIRETAAMRLRRFPARESRKKRSSKIRRKKQWFEYLRQPFFSFFLL